MKKFKIQYAQNNLPDLIFDQLVIASTVAQIYNRFPVSQYKIINIMEI